MEKLNQNKILSNIDNATRQRLSQLEVFSSIDSTNTYLLNAIRKNSATSRHVVLAEHQSAGRGRQEKTWHSLYGQNIALSFSWQLPKSPTSLEGLSIAVGVSIVETLQHLFGDIGVQLKWPNDLLFEQKKLGGILIETRHHASDKIDLVIGIGINLDMSGSKQLDIDQPWTDLSQIIGRIPPRNALIGKLIEHQFRCLDEFAQGGFAAFHRRWEALRSSSATLPTRSG